MITGNIIKILPKNLKSKVEHNQEIRMIMGNINWLTLENLLRSLISIFIFGWVARYLGPEDFGLMNYALSFVALFSVLSSLGLDQILIRNVVSDSENKNKYLGSALILKVFGSLLMIILSVLVMYLIEGEVTVLVIFVFILSFGYVFKAFDVVDLWFTSQVQSRYSVYSRLIAFLTVSSLKVVLILTQSPLIAFIGMFSLDFLIASLFLLFFYYKRTKITPLNWNYNKDVAKKLLNDSWPLIFSGIALMVEANIDQVMLKNMISPEELAMYSAALKIIVGLSFVPMVLKSSFFPSIVKAKAESTRLYEKKLAQFYQIMMIVFLVIAIPLIIFGRPIIHIIYGEEYIAAGFLLQLMATRLFFTNFGVARGNFIINENLMKHSFFTMLVGAVVSVVLNMIFIPMFESVGAIIVSIISFFVTIFLIDLFYHKTRRNSLLMFRSMFDFYKLIFK